MSAVRRYMSKSQVVDAICIDPSNALEAAAWCGGRVRFSARGKVIGIVAPVWRPLVISGEYLVMDWAGRFTGYKRGRFERYYRRVA